MEEREKLEYLVEHEDCWDAPFECKDCPHYETLKKDGICSVSKTLRLSKEKLAMMYATPTFSRNDQVIADGKQWRVDWLDGPYLGLSAVDGSHKELHKNVCRKVSDIVDDVLARVTMP